MPQPSTLGRDSALISVLAVFRNISLQLSYCVCFLSNSHCWAKEGEGQSWPRSCGLVLSRSRLKALNIRYTKLTIHKPQLARNIQLPWICLIYLKYKSPPPENKSSVLLVFSIKKIKDTHNLLYRTRSRPNIKRPFLRTIAMTIISTCHLVSFCVGQTYPFMVTVTVNF